MSNYWNARTLHDELSTYYAQFRGVPAPVNAFTESLWNRIELTEAEEAHARATRR